MTNDRRMKVGENIEKKIWNCLAFVTSERSRHRRRRWHHNISCGHKIQISSHSFAFIFHKCDAVFSFPFCQRYTRILLRVQHTQSPAHRHFCGFRELSSIAIYIWLSKSQRHHQPHKNGRWTRARFHLKHHAWWIQIQSLVLVCAVCVALWQLVIVMDLKMCVKLPSWWTHTAHMRIE